MIPYTVQRIGAKPGREFIRAHHYSRSCHNGPTCYGLFDGDALIGVCAFATPCSENVRAYPFGADHVQRVTELHRLFVHDGTVKNTESWFIARALRQLKQDIPRLWAVVSFADTTEGHVGYVYQACNALYYGPGTDSRRRMYKDQDGRLRHRRQSGHTLTLEEATARGWTPCIRGSKHRYLFLLEKRAKRRLQLTAHPYPKTPSPGGSND